MTPDLRQVGQIRKRRRSETRAGTGTGDSDARGDVKVVNVGEGSMELKVWLRMP